MTNDEVIFESGRTAGRAEAMKHAGWTWDGSEYKPPSLAELLRDMAPAARDVLLERDRQVNEEGYTQQHDDEHIDESIAAMACYYAMPAGVREWSAEDTGYGPTLGDAIIPDGWTAKDCDRRKELVKAAALILAEIERLDRADVLAMLEERG